MAISRIPVSILRGCPFKACPNEPVFISTTDIFVLFPIWRKLDCGGWVDATGEYDLCANDDFSRLKFITCRDECTTYRYNFIPGNWFPKRKGIQTP